MKKTTLLWIILILVFLIVFNVVFFITDTTKSNVSVWISYGIIHFAYFMLLITPKLIRKGKSSAVFGFSLFSISATYFLAVLISGITFILIYPDKYNIALLIQLCITGLYAIILISYMIANEHTADAEENRQYQISYIKDASTRLKSLLERIIDKETKRKVEQVFDAVYSSPVRTHPDLAEI